VRRYVVGLVSVLVFTGCAAAPSPVPPPPPPRTAPAAAPEGGVLLADLGFTHAPAGVSIPAASVIGEYTNAANNVTLVFTGPDGAESAAYLRAALPDAGFEITADDHGSLVFTDGAWQGAFTATGPVSALTLRTDRGRP